MTESEREGAERARVEGPETERRRALAALLQSANEDFADGFADRVMDRVELEAAGRNEVVDLMNRQFRRWAPIGLAAGLALAAFNVSQTRHDAGQSAVEALLGLDPVTLNAAYSIEIPTMSGNGAES